MSAALLPSPSGERLSRLAAYGFAALIHVPLIMAAHQLGEVVAASDPVESVITLLDTPEIDRTAIVPTLAAKAAKVDLDGDARLAAPAPAVPATAAIPPPVTATVAAVASGEKAASRSAPVSAASGATPVPAASTPSAAVATATVSPGTVASASIAAVTTSPPAAPAKVVAAPSSPAPAAATPSLLEAQAPSEAQPAAARPASVDVAAPHVAATSATASAPIRTAAASTGAAAPATAAIDASEAATPAASAAPSALPRIQIPSAPKPSAVVSGALQSGAVASIATPTIARPASTAAAAARPADIATPSAVTAAPSRTAVPAPVSAAVAANSADPDEGLAGRTALNAFVRGYEGGGCFAALPSGSSGDDFAVSGFSRDETALGAFNAALGSATGNRAGGRRVSEAQCSALAFARAQSRYPDFPIRIAVSPDRIASGATIRGAVTGAGSAPVTLLILDDEGRIQDATFLLAGVSAGSWSFETPLSLTGAPVPTVQLFVVLAGDGPAAMRPPVPVEARRYFKEIDRLLRERGQALDVAIAAFTVDQRPAP